MHVHCALEKIQTFRIKLCTEDTLKSRHFGYFEEYSVQGAGM